MANLTMTDVAYNCLSKRKKGMEFIKLYDEVIKTLEIPENLQKKKRAQFYSELMLDNRFANLDNKSNGEIIIKDNIKLGYMLQQDALFNWKTVLDNCLLGLEINNLNNKDYVLKLLNTYGLKDFINSYPNNLSGGMRQRVV